MLEEGALTQNYSLTGTGNGKPQQHEINNNGKQTRRVESTIHHVKFTSSQEIDPYTIISAGYSDE